MSGVIYYARAGVIENVDLIPPDMPVLKQIAWIQSYRADPPKADFAEAVFALFFKFGGKQPRP